MLSKWNESQLTSYLIQQLHLVKFTSQALKSFHTSVTKFCQALLLGLYFSRRHSKTATATKPITSANGTMATRVSSSAVSRYCQDRLSVRFWGCQGHYSAHIKYCIWVYALHSNTYTMALWIVVTSKLCNFAHNNEVLISQHQVSFSCFKVTLYSPLNHIPLMQFNLQ
jgi:hypothetical protein